MSRSADPGSVHSTAMTVVACQTLHLPTVAFLFFIQTDSMDSLGCFPILLNVSGFSFFSVPHFLVAGSVLSTNLTHVSFWSHVKIASRIVSYRILILYAIVTHTHTPVYRPLSRTTQKGKTNLEQETVSGSCIGWAICKSAPRSRQITTPAPHYSLFYRPDALPAAQPTVSKHWRHIITQIRILTAGAAFSRHRSVFLSC